MRHGPALAAGRLLRDLRWFGLAVVVPLALFGVWLASIVYFAG